MKEQRTFIELASNKYHFVEGFTGVIEVLWQLSLGGVTHNVTVQ